MTVIQILIILFALFAFSRSILRIKEKTLTLQEFIFWSLIWILVIITALIPDITSTISQPLGIGRGVDIIIYGSIIALFYLIFRLYIKTEQTNQQLTKLVQELAKQVALNTSSVSTFEPKTKNRSQKLKK